MNIAAGIGHNQPPSPVDEITAKINDLYDEAKQWLDGEPVTTQEQANALNTLETRVREAAKEAETLRKELVKPHDEAKAAIQAQFNPLIGKTTTVTGKAVLAIDAIRKALTPFLLILEREKAAEAERMRAEAERAKAAAAEAMQSRDVANLEEVEKAERLVQDAKDAEKEAMRAAKEKAHAKGEGRATGLRTVWDVKLVDEREAAKWLWLARKDALLEFAELEAVKAVRNGTRAIPGFSVEQRKVV